MILVLAFLQLFTFAKEVHLATVTNDVYPTPYKIGLTIDDSTGDIVNFFVDNEKGKRIGSYVPSELAGGVTIYKARGFSVVKVFSQFMDITKEADFAIELLYSGVSRKKVRFNVMINKVKDSWKASYDDSFFNKIHLIANRSRLLGPIGIANAVINGQDVELQ